MIDFLHPTWLGASALITIPILLHLLSRKTAHRVKIGSVRFLESTTTKKAQRIRVQDWPLLLLRILLLLLLTTVLSQPYWQNSTSSPSKNGIVLWHPEISQQDLTPNAKLVVDSLSENGWEMHQLSIDFPPLSDLSKKPLATNISQWSLIKEANLKFNDDLPFFIVTYPRLREYNGPRPALARDIRFYLVPETQEQPIFLRSYRTNSDSIASIYAQSTNSLVRLEKSLNSPQTSSEEQRLDTLNIQIYVSDSRRQDAVYLEKALLAIQNDPYSTRFAETHVLSDQIIPINLEEIDIVFWLSPQEVPEKLHSNLADHTSLLEDARTDKFIRCSFERLEMVPKSPEAIFIRKRVETPMDSAQVLWRSGSGVGLLGQVSSHPFRGFFVSRFHPEWNDLVLSPVFPEWLAKFTKSTWTHPDQLAPTKYPGELTEHQLKPIEEGQAKNARISLPSSDVEFNPILGFLLFLAFVIERILSGRRKA